MHIRLSGAAVTSTLSAFWAIHTVLKTKGNRVESHDHTNMG